MTSPQLTPGTILIAISEQETVAITLHPNWQKDIIESAKHYHSCLEGLEIAKQRFTNPNHESGNTALIREEIHQALIDLAHTTSQALTELAENEESR